MILDPKLRTTPVNPTEDIKLVLWPDGTWCWHDDFRAGEYGHMSDDYEVIYVTDMPRVERLARADAQLHSDILEELR